MPAACVKAVTGYQWHFLLCSCVVIEDSHIGTLAAKAAGMRYRADLTDMHVLYILTMLQASCVGSANSSH